MLLVCSSYSYSEEVDVVYGASNNAAAFGLHWVMRNVLPQQTGLVVNGVIYRYTTEKLAEDDMLVHVQNENARGSGYIFRSTDDWSGLPGNTIDKSVPVNMIDISYWGPGSIEVEGAGTVTDPEVYYYYQYDPCNDPQSNPSCEGYVDPNVIVNSAVEMTNNGDDTMIQDELDRKANQKAQKEEERENERKRTLVKKKVRVDLEVLLGRAGSNIYNMEVQLIHAEMMALRVLPTSYYETLVGGDYPDKVVYTSEQLPDNKKGLRVGMAQELRHSELVNLQYAK